MRGGRPPLPPRELVSAAAALFVAAIVVSLMIVAGHLEPGEG